MTTGSFSPKPARLPLPSPETRGSHTILTGDPLPAGITAAAVGHKALGLLRLAEAGLSLPSGFVLTTHFCADFFAAGQRLSEECRKLIALGIARIEQATSLTYGGDRRPLLLAVRSGAQISMPGMMDTLLNVGLNDRTASALLRMTGTPRFVWDSYRRLVQTYGELALDVPAAEFQRRLQAALDAEDAPTPAELDAAALRALTAEFRNLIGSQSAAAFPQDPLVQLENAIAAVFRSWNSSRASAYRQLHGIPDDLGTAVTVQAMVYGNLDPSSGAGVAFTRDPATGENELYLDFLANSQGEDVVSGRCAVAGAREVARTAPALANELGRVKQRLEQLFRDAQDFEFTVQSGRLFLLQSRRAKRTARAALRMACEMVAEGLIDEGEALRRLAEYPDDAFDDVGLEAPDGQPPLAVGVGACPGVAVGEICLHPAQVLRVAAEGRPGILVRPDMSTEDIRGMAAATGILTSVGGRTSHAAVVAREMDRPCVVGCRDLAVLDEHQCRVGSQVLHQGETISLDGQSGAVYAGAVQCVRHRPQIFLDQVAGWRRKVAKSAVD